MLQAAEERYAEAARVSAATATVAGAMWDQVPLDALDAWRPERLAVRVAALQLTVAKDADDYLDAVLAEQDLDPEPVGRVRVAALMGVAGDGRSLVTLFDQPRIQAKALIGEGLEAREAWGRARESPRLMAVTAVQDAGRAADSVGMVARPAVDGYVRMLNTPSCSRCTVLAGKFFRWNAGFQRHPRCDCRHVPSTENLSGDLRTDPRQAVLSGQVTGLSRADLQAIRDGADTGQVINATRGLYTADAFGQQAKATTTNARGQMRLRPEAIYRYATDRDDALRLLRRFGYLT